jgi:hypothetical protein
MSRHAPLERKRQSLVNQSRLVQAKREAFEQGLTECAERLQKLRIPQDELVEIAERLEGLDPAALQRQVLESAAENTDLRTYKPLTSEANRVLDELTRLSRGCDELIEKSQGILK